MTRMNMMMIIMMMRLVVMVMMLALLMLMVMQVTMVMMRRRRMRMPKARQGPISYGQWANMVAYAYAFGEIWANRVFSSFPKLQHDCNIHNFQPF